MEQRSDLLKQTGIILCFVGVILQFFRINILDIIPLAPVIYGLGAITMTFGRYFEPVQYDDPRLKRLRVQQCISTILYIAAIYFMWKNDGIWIYAVMIASAIDMVLFLRTPKTE